MFVFERHEIPLFTTRDKTLRDRFQFLPAGADLFGFLFRDLIIGGGCGYDREQIREFLDDFIGGGNQVGWVGLVEFRVKDEEATGPLADPLDESPVLGAVQQSIEPIQWIGAAAPRGRIGRLRPLVDHGERQPEFGRHLFWTALLEDFAQDLV